MRLVRMLAATIAATATIAALTVGWITLATPAEADIVGGQYSLEAIPSTSSAPVGGQFTVGLGVYHSASAYQAVQWSLDYDETKVTVVSIARDVAAPGSCTSSQDNTKRVLAGCIDLGGAVIGYSGNTYNVVFQCIADGNAGLGLITSGPSVPTFVKTTGGATLPSHTHAGSVQCGTGSGGPPPPPPGDHCTIASVVTGDTFTCTDGRTVRMLQIDAQDLNQCGGGWAKAALQYIFLTPGRVVTLEYDATQSAGGQTLAAPLWTGFDGNVYNLSIVMVYVGLAKAANLGDGNVEFLDWANASQVWASVAQWNMWAPGKTYTGGCD